MTGKRLLAGAGVTTVVAALVGVVGAGVSHADQALTLKYSCTFPLIGNQDLSVKIGVGIPDKIVQGQKTPDIPITADVTVPDQATQGLNLVGAKTVEGSAAANATIKIGKTTLPLKPSLAVAKTPVPASGAFVVKSSGSTPGIAPPEAGQGSVTIGDFVATLDPKTADGSDTGLGTFDSKCTLAPGQNPVITFTVTPAGGGDPTNPPTEPTNPPTDPPTNPPTNPPGGGGLHVDYGVAGSTHVKALGADVPVGPGTLGVDLDSATGNFTGDLSLPTANSADFTLLGFLPGKTTVLVAPQGKTTGTFKDNTVTSSSKVNVKITDVALFGVPLVSKSTTCQASTPADIALKSGSDFSIKDGGTLTGSYTLPKLTGCGPFNDYISAFAAGDGNTISLKVAPKTAS